MAGEFAYPADTLHIDAATLFNLKLHELHTVLEDGWETLQFDPERLRNPEYLGMARYLLSDLLATAVTAYPNSGVKIAAALSANQVLNYQGIQKQLLYPDEVDLIINKGLRFPLPWTKLRTLTADPPKKYMPIADNLYSGLEFSAKNNIPMGIVAGCWDILTGGHLAFFRECAMRLHQKAIGMNEWDYYSIAGGVDENNLVARNKGGGKPYNDLSIRAGTLSEFYFITEVFRVPEVWMGLFSRSRYFLPIGIFPSADLDRDLSDAQLKAIGDDMRREDPAWFKYIAPFIFHFWSAGDPVAGLRRRWAEVLGIQYAEVPRFTGMSSTGIASDFGVQPSDYKPNRFGKPAWWQNHLVDLGQMPRNQ